MLLYKLYIRCLLASLLLAIVGWNAAAASSADTAVILQKFRDWRPSQTEEWRANGRYTYEYDARGNLINVLFELYRNDAWANYLKTTYVYADSDSLIEQIERSWENGVWNFTERLLFYYDVRSLQASEEFIKVSERQIWKHGKWVNMSRGETFFNGDGNAEKIVGYLWNEPKRGYQEIGSTIYEYENNGNLQSETRFKHDKPEYQKLYKYNDDGQLLERRDNEIMYTGLGGFGPAFRYMYAYNENGKRAVEIIQGWETDQVWHTQYHITCTYNENGWLVEEESDFLPTESGEHSSTRMRYLYKEAIADRNDTDGPKFGLSLTAIPNPFTEETELHFTLQQASNVALTVVDHRGREVFATEPQILDAGEHTIPLKASAFVNGVYYCLLRYENSMVSLKLLSLR